MTIDKEQAGMSDGVTPGSRIKKEVYACVNKRFEPIDYFTKEFRRLTGVTPELKKDVVKKLFEIQNEYPDFQKQITKILVKTILINKELKVKGGYKIGLNFLIRLDGWNDILNGEFDDLLERGKGKNDKKK